MDEYISKPLDARRLVSMIETLASGAPAPVEPDVLKSVLTSTGGDASLMREICAIFVEHLPGSLQSIRAALDSQDPEALRCAAHALKGSAATFGETPTVALCRALEERGRAGDLHDAESLWRALQAEASTLRSMLQRG